MTLNGDGAQVDPLVELDSQQLALLEVLRRSSDWSASFSELRDAGIEFPASIVEELELIGLPLERRAMRRNALSSPGVRLRPVAAAEPPPFEPAVLTQPAQSSARRLRVPRPRVGSRTALLLVLLALALALALAPTSPVRPRPHSPGALASHTLRAARASPTARPHVPRERAARPRPPAHPTLAERAPTALAAELQASGHAMLESGRGSTAAARLTQALTATGERVADCIEPSSEACLTYAYALYDLGRALALEGRRTEAASVLRQRLRIDNQREVVISALRQVRAAASMPAPHRRAAHQHPTTGSMLAGGVKAPAGASPSGARSEAPASQAD